MKLKIEKWGRSAAVRLPKSMLSQLGAKVGDLLDVTASIGKLSLRISIPKYRVADLLNEMPDGLPGVSI